MPGLLTSARLPRARSLRLGAALTASLRQRRERAVEREFRQMVARGEAPREFAVLVSSQERRPRL